jgi:hypothetical protein
MYDGLIFFASCTITKHTIEKKEWKEKGKKEESPLQHAGI